MNNARIISSLSMLTLVVCQIIACQQKTEPMGVMPPHALGPLSTIDMAINGVDVEIEVAIAPAELQQGLMHRDAMPENHGMLFVYPAPQYMSFWMKNTKIPLSIAFIRDDGIIGNIEKMAPHSGPHDPVDHYRSKYKSVYALEMNQGWFEKNGIQPGDSIDIPHDRIQDMIRAKAR